ncbi:bifunctional UDP-N-acetylglucosamine diphosphorylase/glucosamine-1-phosphate N-acetyltransferase GlmU [Prochlorococcus marinus]|uniref:Bifunctional protein GlmU n=1 Tax=Prochlorococcus marinus XMU1408 TaxID=2213228 RepID=A0A318R5F3_PROMR|nr:bifunctional UDP-N-acetylglucosamine diphosphorylase/glucosamine-1-phosphate N-acetyltransferase GlmU [Prochlorococcus marinus]MBW3041637.1 UDP-N-acetylglucosamine diphosphorylase/glucosamine-1-phosphate N-acetyltransferase [Prochlorococcus marinus str. XMU1408]PYE02791.1 bifunctional UDP-N-acetylglucosamine diphosphorylase/glucosamine-1-phosphate N-acetyltransferase GlmU [Prochlorococcus marinus XMU1408]
MLAIAILAAGKGTRMKSDLPKVLHSLAGKSLIDRVLSCTQRLNPNRRLIVVGHQANVVKDSLKNYQDLDFVLQQPQNGTGHAIQQLGTQLKGFKGELLVLNGDVPLLKEETLNSLLKFHKKSNASVTFLSASLESPTGYGRVITNESGLVSEIIEERDCTNEQRKNKLINAGIYCFNWQQLSDVLNLLSSKNSQNELYLTDTIKLLKKALHFEVDDPFEVKGINDRYQLSECEQHIQETLKSFWMSKGVSFIDPISCSLSEDSDFGTDVIIEPQTHLRGKCNIGNGCRLGPGSVITNSTLEKNVLAIHSFINEATIGNNTSIGPFAHIRPESSISENSKIGNFVEIKKSFIGEGTKINHLSYVGDSTLGKNINVGAGTITANFDGKNKHRTIIDDYSKTGANSVLVAPIKIGSHVTIGAGSTISKDIPDQSLVVERSKAIIRKKNN